MIITDVSSHDCKEKNAGDSLKRTCEISSIFSFDDFWFVSYYGSYRLFYDSYRLFYDKVMCFFS
jgi:hypothetical protein